ncbi:MAG: NAD-dependent epimerase/dehydratase family protein [Nocardioides sp.]
MRILVLGGTVFLSEAVATEAVRRGHEVVCACRGRSGTVPSGAEHVVLDRESGEWPEGLTGVDAVVDVSRTPSHVRAAVAAVPDAHWVFVSTGSVYAENATVGGTPATVPTLDPVTTDEDWTSSPEAYGAMKVACEDIVRAGAASSVVLRPGLIAGPGDPSGRFTYWPVRLAEAGPVLAPPADEVVQTIDVRDLAEWVVTAAEERLDGVYDAVGAPTLRADFLAEVARGVTDVAPEIVWATEEQLLARSVEPWAGPRSLPVWIPGPADRGFMAHDVTPSLAAGLRLRPLAETARATLAWVRATPDAKVTGLTRHEEQDVLTSLTDHPTPPDEV